MAEEKTVPPVEKPLTTRARHKMVTPVGEDRSTLLWRVGSGVAAIGVGLAVAATKVREKFYDEIKKTAGFKERRATNFIDHDNLSIKGAELAGRGNATKFKWYSSKRSALDRDYTEFFAKEMEKRFGIVSGNIFKEPTGIFKEMKGLWQRFRLMGSNNKTSAIINGFVATAATVTGLMMLRENNRLWNRLDEARQKEAQGHEDIKELMAQVSENHSRLIDIAAPTGGNASRSDAHAAPNAADDRGDAQDEKPHAKIRAMGLEHHERVAHADAHHHSV